MPVRVLDRYGSGQADDIARGIHYAVDHGANVINMSFNFGCHKKVPVINEELRRANRAGVVTIASIGNLGAESCVSPPATGPHVLGIGGATEGGCIGAYSLAGKGVDVVAPGGGTPMAGCPSVLTGPIYQVTLKGGNPAVFGEPGDFVGTSMAAAHASGVAAMILASGVIPPKLKGPKLVAAVVARLEGDRPRPRPAADRRGRGADRRRARNRPGGLSPRRLGGVDDHHAAGGVMGDVVRDAAEDESFFPGHPFVADDDEVGVDFLGGVEDRVGRVALDRVDHAPRPPPCEPGRRPLRGSG